MAAQDIPNQAMNTLLAQPVPPPSLLFPTVSHVSKFLSSFLPVRPRDVDFVYHTPRFRPPRQPQQQNPQPCTRTLPTNSTPVTKIVLSITPTPGVYDVLSRPSATPPLAFLHRPFTLDRRRVPRGSLVLSSHVGFDEVLTVGYNTVLACRLGVDIDSSVCLQGYKGDPERRIGIVGLLDSSPSANNIAEDIKSEFGTLDSIHGFSDNDDACPAKVIAIMNAFHLEEVDRVMEAAVSKGWISDKNDGSQVVYLTGQARDQGLAAALEKRMKVVCVGHRTCEEWGVRYLAEQLRREFPILDVVEVFEDEEPLPPRPKKVKAEAVTKADGKVPKVKKQKIADVASA